jgi:hypothetical protein
MPSRKGLEEDQPEAELLVLGGAMEPCTLLAAFQRMAWISLEAPSGLSSLAAFF